MNATSHSEAQRHADPSPNRDPYTFPDLARCCVFGTVSLADFFENSFTRTVRYAALIYDRR